MPDADPDTETIDRRLRAVERAITDADTPPVDLADAAEATDRIERLEDRIDDVDRRLADLEAAVRALRGYVGNVRSVNEDVEQTATAALSTVRSVQRRLDEQDEIGDAGVGAGHPDGGRLWEDVEPDRSAATATTDTETGTGTTTGTATAPGDDETTAESDVRTTEGNSEDHDRARLWEDVTPRESTHRRDERTNDESWPRDGMDVDRAQPWSIPGPDGDDEPRDYGDGDRTLIERVKEAL
jgi:hypothetical protein